LTRKKASENIRGSSPLNNKNTFLLAAKIKAITKVKVQIGVIPRKFLLALFL
jgi:hypothetical protein